MVKKGIVICTWYGGREPLTVLLKSLAHYDEYPIYVVVNGYYFADEQMLESVRDVVGNYRIIANSKNGFELGAIKAAMDFTDLDEFVLLHETMEVLDTDVFRILFEDYEGHSVSYGPDFKNYFLKFRRKVLSQLTIPIINSKVEAVRNEDDFINAYRTIEEPYIFSQGFRDSGRYEERFGRLNQLVQDDYIIKRKGMWDASKLYKDELEHQILDLSHKHKLSHLSSCLTAVHIIDDIFRSMKEGDHFVLSCGHAGMALYVVLQKYFGLSAEEIFLHHGVHPSRCKKCHIEVSSGSLGNGLPIALGMAMTTDKDVYCLISDGECAEGSIWEALAIREKYKVFNLKVYVNCNGWGAYDPIDLDFLGKRLAVFTDIQIVKTHLSLNPYLTNVDPDHRLEGQEGHYLVL